MQRPVDPGRSVAEPVNYDHNFPAEFEDQFFDFTQRFQLVLNQGPKLTQTQSITHRIDLTFGSRSDLGYTRLLKKTTDNAIAGTGNGNAGQPGH